MTRTATPLCCSHRQMNTDLPRMVEVTIYKATQSDAQESEAAEQIEELLRAQQVCSNIAALRSTAHGQAGTACNNLMAESHRQAAYPLGREVYDQPEDLHVDCPSASLRGTPPGSSTVRRAQEGMSESMWGLRAVTNLPGSFPGGSAIPTPAQTP